MMRTPVFIFWMESALMMLRVASMSGVCRVMKSEREKISSSEVISMPSSRGRFGRKVRVVGDNIHAESAGAVCNG